MQFSPIIISTSLCSALVSGDIKLTPCSLICKLAAGLSLPSTAIHAHDDDDVVANDYDNIAETIWMKKEKRKSKASRQRLINIMKY